MHLKINDITSLVACVINCTIQTENMDKNLQQECVYKTKDIPTFARTHTHTHTERERERETYTKSLRNEGRDEAWWEKKRLVFQPFLMQGSWLSYNKSEWERGNFACCCIYLQVMLCMGASFFFRVQMANGFIKWLLVGWKRHTAVIAVSFMVKEPPCGAYFEFWWIWGVVWLHHIIEQRKEGPGPEANGRPNAGLLPAAAFISVHRNALKHTGRTGAHEREKEKNSTKWMRGKVLK